MLLGTEGSVQVNFPVTEIFGNVATAACWTAFENLGLFWSVFISM